MEEDDLFHGEAPAEDDLVDRTGPRGFRLVAECGVFAGISAGAALAGAAKVAAQIDDGTIVFIVSDGGWKYLSTGAYTDDLDLAETNAESMIYF